MHTRSLWLALRAPILSRTINYELATEDEPQNQEASETEEYSDDLLSMGIQDLLDTDDEPDDAFQDYDESMDDMDEYDDVE